MRANAKRRGLNWYRKARTQNVRLLLAWYLARVFQESLQDFEGGRLVVDHHHGRMQQCWVMIVRLNGKPFAPRITTCVGHERMCSLDHRHRRKILVGSHHSPSGFLRFARTGPAAMLRSWCDVRGPDASERSATGFAAARSRVRTRLWHVSRRLVLSSPVGPGHSTYCVAHGPHGSLLLLGLTPSWCWGARGVVALCALFLRIASSESSSP